MFNVVGTMELNVPGSEVAGLVGALLAAVPSDVTGATGELTESIPSTMTGNFDVKVNFSASMSQADISALSAAVLAAIPADSTLLSFNFQSTPAQAPSKTGA